MFHEDSKYLQYLVYFTKSKQPCKSVKFLLTGVIKKYNVRAWDTWEMTRLNSLIYQALIYKQYAVISGKEEIPGRLVLSLK